MKDTNAIEKAIKKKIDKEIEGIVNNFIYDLKHKISKPYGGSSFYRFRFKNKETELMHDYEVKKSLIELIKENHGESMLNVKSNELLKKLELL
tara:strand:- start:214 stop:492 length:279 start_codon:yes stop_codon:yes gene_type:complete